MPETLRSHTAPLAKKGSPGPFCSLTSHHCHAHLASGHSLSQSLPLPHSPLELTWHHGDPERSHAWMADAGDSTALCAPHLCHVPTNQAWQLAATLHRTRVESIPASLPPSSPQPHPQRDRHPISHQRFPQGVAGPKAAPCKPRRAGAPGHPQPAAPGCLLPWGRRQRRGQQGWSGREEGAPAVAQASRELNMNSRAV